MQSAPPRMLASAASTTLGSYVLRASRTVATWSIFMPSSNMLPEVVYQVDQVDASFETVMRAPSLLA